MQANRPGGLTEADLFANRAPLLAQARRLVRHEADAEDVVQEAMERAWRFRHQFKPGSNAAPWLRAIARNVAQDLLRTRRFQAEAITEPQATEGLPEATALRRERARSIDAALHALEPAYRDAVVLHDYYGFTNHEIAQRKRKPYHTVRTHLFRARRALRRALSTGAAA